MCYTVKTTLCTLKKKKAAEKSAAGAEAFDEYRNLRERGYSRDEASFIMAKKAPMYILSAKADDYIGKNSRIDEVLYSKTHTFDPEDNKKFREALNSRNTNDIIITGAQIGKKLGKHTKEYEINPGSVDDRIKLLNIVDDIIDNADEVVEGNWKGYGNTLFIEKEKTLFWLRKKASNL